MVFMHAGVEDEVGHVSEDRINNQPLERFLLSRKDDKNSAIARVKQDFLRQFYERFMSVDYADLAILERSVFFRLSKMERPGVQPAEIQRQPREIVVTHRKLKRMNDRRTENGGERHCDKNCCDGEWHDLPPEFVTPRRDILNRAPDVDANKRSDNQRLPLDRAADRKQKNSEGEISTLQT